MTDMQKVELVTEKLSTHDYQTFANRILPLTKATISFADAITQLKLIFGMKESQFALRYTYLQIKKIADGDWDDYVAKVNLRVEKFKLGSLDAEDFKVLMFVQGLCESKDACSLERLLSKLDEQEKKRESAGDPTTVPKVKLKDVNEYVKRLGSLKTETSMVMSPDAMPEVLSIQQSPHSKWNSKTNFGHSSVAGYAPTLAPSSGPRTSREPERACMLCGGMHWQADCSFKGKICSNCNTKGHKTGYFKSAV